MHFDKRTIARDIAISVDNFAEPDLKIVTQTSVRPVNDPTVQPVSVSHLEDMVTTLLATAAASGKNLTIENKGYPKYGMGGYHSNVKIRPSYPNVRDAMAEIANRKAGLPTVKVSQESTQDLLKARNIPWDGSTDAVRNSLLRDPSHLPHHELVALVREYDRRLMQMWDKVGFEAKHELTDYSPILKVSPPSFKPADNSVLTMKPADHYAQGEAAPIYQRHLLWDAVFGEKYGMAPLLPYQAVKVHVPPDTEEKIMEWTLLIEDEQLGSRIYRYLNAAKHQGKQFTFNALTIPLTIFEAIGIPIEMRFGPASVSGHQA